MINRRRALMLGTLLPVAYALPAYAQTPEIYAENGIAIDGTDVMSYFVDGAPQPGNPAITHTWNGATWQFASVEHRDAFAADPARYAPQYGGYCAYAVSEGYTASTVPDAWKIVDDKLYLNFSRRIQRRWERDIPGRIASGDANWPRVLN
ncbi:MAG: YHS domain-containing (seleno)protein [Pseudomonadota bacterium]